MVFSSWYLSPIAAQRISYVLFDGRRRIRTDADGPGLTRTDWMDPDGPGWTRMILDGLRQTWMRNEKCKVVDRRNTYMVPAAYSAFDARFKLNVNFLRFENSNSFYKYNTSTPMSDR